MKVSGHSIFRSAVLGFSITAAFVSYQILTDPQSALARSSTIMLTFLVLCPPSILSITRQTEFGTDSYYILWIVIGLLNAALYAGVRVMLKRRLQRPD
jgi:hypothetical protein